MKPGGHVPRWSAVLIIVSACLFIFAGPLSAQPRVELSAAEKAWLAAHPTLRLGTVPDWAPISMRGKDGALDGMAGDYRKLIEKDLPLSFAPAPEMPWEQVLESVRRRELDAVLLLGQTPERDNYLLFTDALVEIPYVIITRTDNRDVRGIGSLAGKRVSVRRHFVSHEWLAGEHPEVLLTPKPTTLAAMQAVLLGEADAFVGSLADAGYTITASGLTNLKVAAGASFTNRLRMGVRNDWPELVAILNKGIAGITPEERLAVWNRWVYLRQEGIDTRYVLYLAAGFAVLLAGGLLFYNVRLRRAYAEVDEKVQTRTAELQRLNATLAESEARYHEIFEQVSDYILVLEARPDGPPLIVDASASAFAVHGYTRQEMLGKPITLLDLEPPKVPGNVERIMRDGSARFEAQHRRKDGSSFLAEIWAKAITAGGKTFFYTVERDITQRKQAENILRYRASLSEMAPVLTMDELIQEGLDQAEKFTGSTIGYFHFVDDDQENLTLQTWSTNTLMKMCTAEGKGKHYPISEAGVWVDCFHERKAVVHNDYASLPGKKGLPEGHAPLIRELGAPVMHGGRVAAIMGLGNKPTDYMSEDVAFVVEAASILYDLIQRKRAETALGESEQRYRLLVQSSPFCIHEIGLDGRLQSMNEAGICMLGLKEERDVVGVEYLSAVADADKGRIGGLLRGAINGAPSHFEFLSSDAAPKTYKSCFVPIRGPGGKVAKLMGITEDITERKRQEEALIAAKLAAEAATKSRTQLLSLLSHDLKGPLTAMTGFVKILRMNEARTLTANQAEMLDRAIDAGRKMSVLVEDILNLSRLRMGTLKLNMEFFDAALVGKRMVADFSHAAAEKGITLTSDVPEHSRLYTDRTLFTEVVNNFVTNAIKFCGKGDAVRFSVSFNASATFCVEDSGPGMPPEMVENLLNEVKQASTPGSAGERGSGFGLIIAQEVLKSLGGTMLVESAPGKGSRFMARLPIVRPRVLLVDDESSFRYLLKQYLKPLEAEIIEFDDGQAAADFLAFSAELPHLIITDLEMPKMGGLELLSHINKKHETGNIPVMVISGKHGMEIRDTVYGMGAKDFLTKEIDMDDFIPRIRRYIG